MTPWDLRVGAGARAGSRIGVLDERIVKGSSRWGRGGVAFAVLSGAGLAGRGLCLALVWGDVRNAFLPTRDPRGSALQRPGAHPECGATTPAGFPAWACFAACPATDLDRGRRPGSLLDAGAAKARSRAARASLCCRRLELPHKLRRSPPSIE